MSSTDKSPASGEAAASSAKNTNQQTPQPAVTLDDSGAAVCYANFCRVTGTPEELLLDFGLNSQPYGTPTEPIEVKQRLVVNYFTAKRMLQALATSVARHEQAFGALEIDVQKRVVAPAAAAGSSP